ncbi:MAG: alpha-L-fucosidase [Bacteroidales bacterium]
MRLVTRIFLQAAFLLLVSECATAQAPAVNDAKMKWFHDARLGIFIHWGIYSVDGIDESWSFYNGYISYPDYMKQLSGFTASAYNPGDWAALIKESGAKYAVITTKHHDGVALWNTSAGDLNVVRKTPAARDLVTPLCKALVKNNIKVGTYFSLLDWSHPDYPNFTQKEKKYTSDTARWNRFTKFNFAQIRELGEFQPRSLLVRWRLGTVG